MGHRHHRRPLAVSMAFLYWQVALVVVFLCSLHRLLKFNKPHNLPPSPWSLPLIGHLHLLRGLPHDAFARLSNKYGDIILLQLGRVPAIVISTPKLAKEVLKDLDHTFASRPATIYGQYGMCYQDMALVPYNNHWKNMRKLCTTELFTARRIDSFLGVRLEELTHMLTAMVDSHKGRKPVNVRSMIATLNFNTITRILMSKRFFSFNDENSLDVKEAKEFTAVNDEAVYESLQFRIGDFVPSYLRWIDWTIPRVKDIYKKQQKFMQKFVDEHKAELNTGKFQDFMEIMLRYTKDDPNGDSIVKMMIVELVMAGTDTSSSVLEWGLAELFLSPTVLRKCQEELERMVGRTRMVGESDIKDLPYFQATVKEVFRLHPPLGTLIPYMSTQACKVAGYDVPKGATTFINVHGMGRDPRVWEAPTEFRPERVLGKSTDVKGQDFELLPFGSGRRGCPGMMLGLRTVQLVLANLVHGFNWSSVPGKEGSYNLEERGGAVTWLKTPLELVCTPRFPEEVYKTLS